MGGTYVLLVDVPRATSIDVGALGTCDFSAGTYAYVGSAFGSGGFARLDRHRELARGDRETRHWHIDCLLGHPETGLEAAITFPDAARECELAATLPGEPVPEFGSSDCDCPAHLLAAPDCETIREAAIEAGGIRDRDR